ncbi:MAG TPA: S9 family peptidase [Gemmatirosa sp.]
MHARPFRAGLVGAFALAAAVAPAAAQTPRAPVAARHPQVDTLTGEVRTDDYAWLKNKRDPAVLAYLRAENTYGDSVTAHTASLRDTLYREMLARMKETDLSVPYRKDGYWYYTRTEQGKAYPIYCRRRGTMSAPEEVVLDQNARAAGKKFHGLGGFDVSPDGSTLLFLEDTTALRVYTLYAKDLKTGRLVDTVPNVTGATAWANDNRTFFYVTGDSARRDNAVWRHTLGGSHGADPNVFREDSLLYNVGLERTRDGRYVVMGAQSFTTSDWRVISADRPDDTPHATGGRRDGVEYTLEHGPGGWFIRTNAGGAVNFKIVQAPDANPTPSAWTEWLPHRDSAFVESVDAFHDFVVVSERTGGMRRLRITELDGGRAHTVALPEAAYGVFPSDNEEFATPTYRFVYSSLVTPNTVYDYDVAARRLEVKKRVDVPTYDASRYEVRRMMITARDGTPVPVSMLTRRGAPPDPKRPLLLYAYGSYGYTTEPTFHPTVFSLVDRGFVYAIAHIRGGQEMGRPWYDAGKMLHKRNTFYDFEDVAEGLVKLHYTSPDRLVANGGSAGGLLMGVIANERPQDFKAIVADVPFVDVVNTMLDASLPLTAQEWLQWGNPRVPSEYAYLKTYSPYDNVRAQAYPWMLVTSSLNDSQVAFHEPTKWVAKLRATKTDTNPLVLHMNMNGGHGGSSGRYDLLHEQAYRYAFMLDAVGLAGGTRPAGAAMQP